MEYLYIAYENPCGEKDEDGIEIPCLVAPSEFGIEVHHDPVTLIKLEKFIKDLTKELRNALQLRHRLVLKLKREQEKEGMYKKEV